MNTRGHHLPTSTRPASTRQPRSRSFRFASVSDRDFDRFKYQLDLLAECTYRTTDYSQD